MTRRPAIERAMLGASQALGLAQRAGPGPPGRGTPRRQASVIIESLLGSAWLCQIRV